MRRPRPLWCKTSVLLSSLLMAVLHSLGDCLDQLPSGIQPHLQHIYGGALQVMLATKPTIKCLKCIGSLLHQLQQLVLLSSFLHHQWKLFDADDGYYPPVPSAQTGSLLTSWCILCALKSRINTVNVLDMILFWSCEPVGALNCTLTSKLISRRRQPGAVQIRTQPCSGTSAARSNSRIQQDK